MADSSIMEQLQSHHEGIVDVYGVSMATSMRFCAISRLINWYIDCCMYTGFPCSCNNIVQANLRTRKITHGKFDSPQP